MDYEGLTFLGPGKNDIQLIYRDFKEIQEKISLKRPVLVTQQKLHPQEPESTLFLVYEGLNSFHTYPPSFFEYWKRRKLKETGPVRGPNRS